MATYVIADIHGCYTEFMSLLDKIAFNPDKDELIIAGDIIDRGPESFEMLRYMESKPKSVQFIIGNHDVDFMHYCMQIEKMYEFGEHKGRVQNILNSPYFQFRVPDYYNTVHQLLWDHNLTKKDFANWKKCFSLMPYFVERKINNKNYIIAHGGYISSADFDNFLCHERYTDLDTINTFYVWARTEHVKYGGKPNTTIVFGHTPTFMHEGFYNKGNVYYYKRKEDNCRFFNIDCGLVYEKNYPGQCNGKLACLRLDDEQVLYQEPIG